jgi:flap endonuclease-1
MGVKISELVEKRDLKWEELNGKSLAIDASNVLFQFMSSIRQQDGTPLMDRQGRVTSHLMGLFTRVPSLIEKGINPVFVFDGKAPELKENVREIRRANKAKALERYERAMLEGEDAGKYAKQLSFMNKEMFEESKELLKSMGVSVVQAPSEAEAQCAYMARKKVVWASASQDYDSLLFGAPKLVFNLTLSQKRKISGSKYVYIAPYLVELDKVLKQLELTQDDLIILGVMVGTDYNPKGISGIGPKKALKLLHEERDYSKIFSRFDLDFDWKEIYSTFKKIPVDDFSLKKEKMNPEKVKEILVEEHDFSRERVEKALLELGRRDKSSLSKWF